MSPLRYFVSRIQFLSRGSSCIAAAAIRLRNVPGRNSRQQIPPV
jgi:hypothetical protein